ncbi:MAG: RlmE family RNA methyltransferase, partial [Spirochaetes bacterium]|nr:RlmE family RNA methyltransferase [Spirochaetota bacterium]
MAKRGRRRQDHLARKAQAEGFHARSVYKLDELQKRHALLRPGTRVLDLGAAPGS